MRIKKSDIRINRIYKKCLETLYASNNSFHKVLFSLSTLIHLKIINDAGEAVENPFLALNEAICIAWFTLEYFLRYNSCLK